MEVFLCSARSPTWTPHFLHVCGGVSKTLIIDPLVTRFSPRMWRCFHSEQRKRKIQKIFSTYVEVFPYSGSKVQVSALFSPRMWRCFRGRFAFFGLPKIFSTYVEVFLSPLGLILLTIEFSPRMWRCFQRGEHENKWIPIFSTYVEVFLENQLLTIWRYYFLHVCGGVSWAETNSSSIS